MLHNVLWKVFIEYNTTMINYLCGYDYVNIHKEKG